MHKQKIKYSIVLVLLLGSITLVQSQSFQRDTSEESRIKYFGFDIGPKYDHYRASQVGGASYSPNLNVIKDIGATAGLTFGVFMEDKYLVELGIFRNNYKAKLDFVSPQGNIFFQNTIVNTFSSYAIPVRVGTRIFEHSRNSMFFFQVGVTTLLKAKLDFDAPKYSFTDEKLVDNEIVDWMNYVITDDVMDGKVMTMDVALVWNYAIRRNLFFTTTISGRTGIGGENRFTTIHNTTNEDHTADVVGIKNYVSTNGTGMNLTLGFRYFAFE